MKVRISKTEWWPVYRFSDEGLEVEVSAETRAIWKDVFERFNEVQEELSDIYGYVESQQAARTAPGKRPGEEEGTRRLPQWDYAYVRVVDEQRWITECLWEQGREGWDLASVVHFQGTAHLYFKRQLVAADEQS
jgi:hypothetical protein